MNGDGVVSNKVREAAEKLASLIDQIRKPLPTGTGDGTDLKDEPSDVVQAITSALGDVTHLDLDDYVTLSNVLKEKLNGPLQDDKDYLMEKLITVVSKLSDDSKLGKKLTGDFVSVLYNDLQHPPQSYLGSDYQYRSADGSFNSLIHPNLGKANTPYARTVPPKTMQNGALPDPSVLFDTLLVRKHNDKHPNQISSMLFYIASIIIHDLFRTDRKDFRNSTTSSYLELSPLYGSNADEQKMMRTFQDGKLKPDCFSEKRILSFPPGVGCILIMFNRFHNHVVEQLALINENDRFVRPTKTELKADKDGNFPPDWKKFDEDLFQVGRLITCGLYINIILIDYVRTILNLQRTNSNWALDPRMEIKGVERGAGNQVSAEFNLVYRWHSVLSERDAKWTKDALWDKMFPDGRDPMDVGWQEFAQAAGKLDASIDSKSTDRSKPDPFLREFEGLRRNADGRFPDEALVTMLSDSIDDCANAYGANRTPPVMRAVEILGIMQARTWNVATLNEFRIHFGLEPHKTFEDINSDKNVSEALKHLYQHPDLVELYPGLVVEDSKTPMTPGAGLTPGFTVSRAVLSDAVALVRGDRFYTIDYHPRKLTNWGYTEVDTDKTINNGCVMYKLFLRAFPNWFQPDSVWAHYPLTTHEPMKRILMDLNKAHLYSFDKPSKQVHPKMITTHAAAKSILENQNDFHVTWGRALEFLMGPDARDFMLAGDAKPNAESRKMMGKALYIDEWEKDVKEYYEKKTKELLEKKSYNLAGKNQVDIIRDVGNLAHVHFAADMFDIPLKTENDPRDLFTEHELYMIMSAVFICVFFDLDPANSFPLRVKAHDATQTLGKIMELKVKAIDSSGFVGEAVHKAKESWSPSAVKLHDYGRHMITRLLDTGMEPKKLVWGHILGTAGGMVANQGQLLGQTLDYFLTDDEGKKHWPAICALAKDPSPKAFDKLEKYFLEGSRLYGETGVFREVMTATTLQDGKKSINVVPGDRLMVNLKAASRDPLVFPDPDVVKLDRDIDSYIHLGHGPHQCLGWRMTRIALTTMLKVIAGLDGLKPVLGPQGRVAKVLKPFEDKEEDAVPDSWHYHAYLTEKGDKYFPFPCSLKVNWDGAVP
ncbi:hypothetical protein K402DRAFT_409649 [Aulographum hederae CBS 113979]|uniref:Heme peroxidase n=1 Tax=Aulographum hederae CBS 113979 TaxID=1176131 RepID=A0A6G1HEJ4_9PEZI|nr:hypothetical protein K402DRAFT_409649 [Aulographum hederae CBS 113979]